MRTRNRFTKNLFEARGSSDLNPEDEKTVFISYRRKPSDRQLAIDCASILENTPGLTFWFDEHDECMAEAQYQNSETAIATCIEQGLDAASALLGIIGPETFSSPWIPYEIGGARGRQSFIKPFHTAPPPHPLIAHLIHNDVNMSEVPGFVGLGIPLRCLCEVEQWAKSVAGILIQIRGAVIGTKLFTETRNIQNRHGIQAIYDRNAPLLRNL